MPRGINYPFYVPSSLAEVARLIASRRPADAVELLRAKAKFSNHSAAAMLALVHLHGSTPSAEYADAVRNCKTAASAGNPFAEFVLAHVYLTAGEKREGIAWLHKSSNQLFPPALSHMGRMMANGDGFAAPDRSSALQMYWLAIKFGHVPTIGLAAKLFIKSRNPLVCLAGLLLFPAAFVAAVIFFQLAPFDLRVFVHVPGQGRPLFDAGK